MDLSDSQPSPAPILADRRLLWPLPLHCVGSPVLTPLSFAHIPPPLPRSSRRMLFTLSSLPVFGLRRCSDGLDRYIGLFEAFSAFNFHCGLHARWFAQRTFCIKGFNRSIARPYCLDCFGWNASCRVGYLPPTGSRCPFHGTPELHPLRPPALCVRMSFCRESI